MSYCNEKRTPQPSIQNLEISLTNAELKLEELLKIKLSEHKDISDSLSGIAIDCKTWYKEYCDINLKLVDSKIKNGSLSNADELRNRKQEMKAEVKQFISLINSYLDQYHIDITFNTSSVNNLEINEQFHERSDLDNSVNSLRSSTPKCLSNLERECPTASAAVTFSSNSVSYNVVETPMAVENRASFRMTQRVPTYPTPAVGRSLSALSTPTMTERAPFSVGASGSSHLHRSATSTVGRMEVPVMLESRSKSGVSASDYPAPDVGSQMYLSSSADHGYQLNKPDSATSTVGRKGVRWDLPISVESRSRNGECSFDYSAPVVGGQMHLSTSADPGNQLHMLDSATATVESSGQNLNTYMPANMYPESVHKSKIPPIITDTMHSDIRRPAVRQDHVHQSATRNEYVFDQNATSTGGSHGHYNTSVFTRAQAPSSTASTAHMSTVFSRNEPQVRFMSNHDPRFHSSSYQSPRDTYCTPQLHHSASSVPQTHSYHSSPTDILASHIVKNQLFQKVGEPFNGEPQKYHSWKKVLERKMAGMTLDPWDVLTVLYENSTDPPRKIIEDFMNIGTVDPESTLNDVLDTL